MPTADEIFGPYPNGAGDVYADPLAADLALREALGRHPNAVLAELRQAREKGDARGEAAAARAFLAAVRQVFKLMPFDPGSGKGVTDGRAWALWDRFADFFGKCGGNTASSPPSPPPDSSPSTSAP